MEETNLSPMERRILEIMSYVHGYKATDIRSMLGLGETLSEDYVEAMRSLIILGLIKNYTNNSGDICYKKVL